MMQGLQRPGWVFDNLGEGGGTGGRGGKGGAVNVKVCAGYVGMTWALPIIHYRAIVWDVATGD